MSTTRISEHLGSLVREAVDKHAGDLDLHWDLGAPTVDPVLAFLGWHLSLVMMTPVPDSDNYAQVNTALAPLGPEAADIDEVVKDMIAQLVTLRDEQAARLAAPRN